MSPSWVRFLVYNTGLVQYRWTGLDLLTADRLKMQEWKILNSSKYSLSCCTYVFHPCTFVFTHSVLAYSSPRYFRFPYLRFQSPPKSLLDRVVSVGRECRPVCRVTTWHSAVRVAPRSEWQLESLWIHSSLKATRSLKPLPLKFSAVVANLFRFASISRALTRGRTDHFGSCL